MQTENLIFNDSSQGQVVEEVSQEFPNICVAILSHALVVKAINLSDLARFMVTSQNADSVSVANFEANEQRHSLNRVVASVHVVTHEEVVGVGWLAPNFEKLDQVVELTVNVTADSDGTTNRLHIWFLNEDFFSL